MPSPDGASNIESPPSPSIATAKSDKEEGSGTDSGVVTATLSKFTCPAESQFNATANWPLKSGV